MPFKKGRPKTGGRQPGVQNRMTRTVKETVLEVFNKLQQDPVHNLEKFAEKHPRDFYQIAAKLIPTELTGAVAMLPAPVINNYGDNSPEPEGN